MNTAAAFRWCRARAGAHYENFPVASLLLPRRLRDPVAAIYAFAREADDLADEGEWPPAARLAALDAFATGVDAAAAGRPVARGDDPYEPVWVALAETLRRHRLPVQLFHDLLDAFRQDVVQTRYANFGELMDYCRRSANPVGRLMLHLHGNTGERLLAWSDAVCSALQLINFLQDIGQDACENGRIYLPQDEMKRFGVPECDILQRRTSPALAALLRFQVGRAQRLLHAGSPLGRALGGRFGLEIRVIVLAGARVLEKLHTRQDPFVRPRLEPRDRLGILWGALKPGRGPIPRTPQSR